MATDGGMVSRPLDVGYLGIYTIWTNNLGRSCFYLAQQAAHLLTLMQGVNPTPGSLKLIKSPTPTCGSAA